MKKALAVMLALVLAVFTGCSAADVEVSPTPVPTPPVQEYAESDPITVTVTPVELTEEEQEISKLSSRIKDDVHVYDLEADGEIARAFATVFSLVDGAWEHYTPAVVFDPAEGRFSVVSSGQADGATLNFTTTDGSIRSVGWSGFEPPDAGYHLSGPLGRTSHRADGAEHPRRRPGLWHLRPGDGQRRSRQRRPRGLL